MQVQRRGGLDATQSQWLHDTCPVARRKLVVPFLQRLHDLPRGAQNVGAKECDVSGGKAGGMADCPCGCPSR